MKTVTVDPPPSAATLYLGALRGSRKRPGAIAALPEVSYVLPRVVIDPAQLARYGGVCGFSDAQGVPVVYPQMLSFPLVMAFFGSDDCPWPALGTVHLANRIEQRRRLSPGDALRVELRTGRLYAHAKGQVFTLETTITRADDIVWTATHVVLRVGVRNPAGPAYSGDLDGCDAAAETPLSHQADFSAPGDIGRRYGRVSGDLNPIHLAALSARLFGFRRAIAHGMWTKARALAALLPQEPVAQAAAAVEFKAPLYLPARVSLWAAHSAQGARFEVRSADGDRPHLRGRLSYQLS